jgi:aspartate racemase
MCIESLDISKSFSLRGGAITDDASWAAYDRYFREALLRLEASGVKSALIASSTPHNRFAAITKGIRMPVLSIFEAVARECARLAIDEVLVLGTAPTMDLPVFPEVLARFGIRARVPPAPERAEVVALISELQADRAADAAARIRAVVDASFPADSRYRAVCLACTELPLAFPALERDSATVLDGVTYLSSTMIHVRAAFAAITARRP